MARTDTHRPSAINPEEYRYVGALMRPEADDWAAAAAERDRIEAYRSQNGLRWANHDHGGTCHVCGAWALDMAVFHHAPSGTLIRTGFDCADKLEEGHQGAFRKLREGMHGYLEAKAGKAKAHRILSERGLLEHVEPLFNVFGGAVAIPDHYLLRGFEEAIAQKQAIMVDMTMKLIRNGSLSEAQWAFFEKIPGIIEDLREKQAAREAEQADLPPAPEGRIEITATVLSVKVQEGYYGDQLKMLLKHPTGWKAWCSVPSSISPERGDTVALNVTLKRSDDDPSFAFGSRPAKARILETAAA